ncbi:type IV secretory system conjugative DNA transfer family protein [Heliorestis convoluta]|uniref:Type IV secretory system conjugative DNA transfer family protein n=1 Tax=Heliorestis convoluta TaxID=356322 RepID=A0A5Q2MWI3_9FIRM|nr:type IV secretory system conjugative DNA transfer family protein [Heliorestis convoluta]
MVLLDKIVLSLSLLLFFLSAIWSLKVGGLWLPFSFILVALIGYVVASKDSRDTQKRNRYGWSAIVSFSWFITVLLSMVLHPFLVHLSRTEGATFFHGMISFTVSMIPFLLLLIGGLFFYQFHAKNDPRVKKAEVNSNGLWQKITSFFSKTEKKTGSETIDVEICKDRESGDPVVINGKDRFLHMLVVGPTGSGKTSSIIKPMLYQDMKRIASGEKIGVTVIEPSGDLADWVAEMANKMGIPCIHVDPTKPNTHKFNPMQGEANAVAEATRTVLRSLFGDQEAFFAQVQESMARNTILLLKRLHGDKLDFLSVMRILQDTKDLEQAVKDYESKYGYDDLVRYFYSEAFGAMRDKLFQFATGIRQQLADIGGNELLQRVLIGNSDINLDDHLKGGGVLAVNTAMGPLGKLGNTFGQFMIMHFQSAVFRRPGDEWTRDPHVLCIDEFPLYINPDFIRFLTNARKYRCAGILAVQDHGQLLDAGTRSFKNTLLNNCRNKVWFGGLSAEDAKEVETQCGSVEIHLEQKTYDGAIFKPFLPKSIRETDTLKPRFDYTYIMELPERHVIYKIVKQNSQQPPREGICDYVKEEKSALDEFWERIEKVIPQVTMIKKWLALKKKAEAALKDPDDVEQAGRVIREIQELEQNLSEYDKDTLEKKLFGKLQDKLRKKLKHMKERLAVECMGLTPTTEVVKEKAQEIPEPVVAKGGEEKSFEIIFVADEKELSENAKKETKRKEQKKEDSDLVDQQPKIVTSKVLESVIKKEALEKGNVPEAKPLSSSPEQNTKVTEQKAEQSKPKEDKKRICPSCSRLLEQRKGRNGYFYGCTGFPKCKHTENI